MSLREKENMLSVPSWQSQCESQTESAVFCKCSPFSDDKTTVVLYVHELVTVYSSSFHPYLGKKNVPRCSEWSVFCFMQHHVYSSFLKLSTSSCAYRFLTLKEFACAYTKPVFILKCSALHWLCTHRTLTVRLKQTQMQLCRELLRCVHEMCLDIQKHFVLSEHVLVSVKLTDTSFPFALGKRLCSDGL